MACLPLQRSVTGRSDTTVKLQWKPLGHEISKLVMQYAILNGKNTFADVKKNGGKDLVLSDPQSIDSYVVKRLTADTDCAGFCAAPPFLNPIDLCFPIPETSMLYSVPGVAYNHLTGLRPLPAPFSRSSDCGWSTSTQTCSG